MQASRRVEDEMARRQLDAVGTIVIVDLQFAPIIFLGFRQEQSNRKIGADAQACKAVAPDAVIDVLSEELPRYVLIEQRWEDVQRHRRRNEQGVGCERTENPLAELPGRLAVGRQLVVLLHLRRLRASRGSAI